MGVIKGTKLCLQWMARATMTARILCSWVHMWIGQNEDMRAYKEQWELITSTLN